MSCGPTNNPYWKKGSYQTTGDLNEIISNWKPEMMLPQAKSFGIKYE